MKTIERKPLISIIVPVYNTGEEYLAKCLDSILAQSYSNFEVIIVYDKSTDGSERICEKYQAMDERVFVLRKEKREGLSSARNAGLDISHGEFITFVDGDDRLGEKYLDSLSSQLIIDSTIDISIGGAIKVLDTGVEIEFVPSRKPVMMDRSEALRSLLDRKIGRWNIWGKMYRATLFEEFRFRNDLKVGEDLDGSWKLYNIARKFYYNGSSEYYYIERNASLVHINYLGACNVFDTMCEAFYFPLVQTDIVLMEMMRLSFIDGLYGTIKRGVFKDDILENDIKYYYDRFIEEMRKSLWTIKNDSVRNYVSEQLVGSFEDFMKTQRNYIIKIRKCDNIYIYGAGRFANIVAEYFLKLGIKIKGFVVSNGQPIGNSPDGVHEVMYFSDLENVVDCEIFIAMDLRHIMEVLPYINGVKKIWFL